MEINFYQIEGDLGNAIAPLMLKILGEKKRAVIFSKDQDLISQLDKKLWIYGRDKFIPHALESDSDFDSERQPILITSEEKNANNADYLVFLDEPSGEFAKKFSRIFYFFEEGKMNSNLTPTKSYKKQGGKWVKA